MIGAELDGHIADLVASAVWEECTLRGVVALDRDVGDLIAAVADRMVRRGLLLGYTLGQAQPLSDDEAPVTPWTP